MADKADKIRPPKTDLGSDPAEPRPLPPEELDALLDAMPSEAFGEDQVHRMMQKVRFRLIVERLKVRDQAAGELIEFLRQTEAVHWVQPPPPLRHSEWESRIPAAAAFQPDHPRPPKVSAPHPTKLLELPRRPKATPPGSRAWGKDVQTWARRHQGKMTAALVSLVLTAGLIQGLNMLVRAEDNGVATLSSDHAGFHKQFRTTLQAKAQAEHRADDNLQFVGRVIQQFCASVSQSCIPSTPQILTPRDRIQLQRAYDACQNFIAQNASNAERKKEAGQARYWMASILLLLGHQEEARSAYLQAIPLLRELAEEFPEEPSFETVLAETQLNLGMLLVEIGRPKAEAEHAYTEALEGFVKLTEKYPDQPNYQFKLADTHKQRGVFFGSIGQRRKAENEFLKALDLFTSPTPTPGQDMPNPFRLGQMESHLNLGRLQVAAQQYGSALKSYTKAVALLNGLPEELPNVPDYRIFLAGEFNELGNRFFQSQRQPEARQAYEQARELCAAVVKEHPKGPAYLSQFGVALTQLALLSREEGNLAESCRLLSLAGDRLRAAVSVCPECQSFREALRDADLALAATQLRRQNYREAAGAALRLPEACPENWQEHYRAVSYLSRCLDMAAKDPSLGPDESQRVTADFTRELRKQLRDLDKTANTDPAAGNALAWFLATCPQQELRDAPRALELAKKTTGRFPDKGSYWNTRGIAHYRMSEWPEAIAALRQSMKLKRAGDEADWFFLAMAHWQLGQKAEARKWYTQALAWHKRHKPNDEELNRFLAEVAELMGTPDALTRGDSTTQPGP